MRHRKHAAGFIVFVCIGFFVGGCGPAGENVLSDTPARGDQTGSGNGDGGDGTGGDGTGGDGTATGDGGWVDDGREFGGDPQSAKAYRETLTKDEAYHLLRHAAFGATPAQVDAAAAAGLTATVSDLLTYKAVPQEITTLADSFDEDPDHRWLVYLIESSNPLFEHLATFWHDRFATSRRVLTYNDRSVAQIHMDMLRVYALGNYRDFLGPLTIDPMMLVWLDGANSPKESPNENYAREFWELFTLGRDTVYTEHDVVESARAFTGITLFRENGEDTRPIFDILHHDETAKSIFPDRATPANFDYRSVINLTLAQPEAARYVARNLFDYFVHDHPSEALIQELADVFVAANFQIEPLVRTILQSSAMFSQDAMGNQISSPIEHVVGVARTLDMHIYSEDSQGYVLDQLTDDLKGAGHELLNPPDVSGWGENEYWLQDQWVLSRIRALGRTMEYGPTRDEDLPLQILPPRSEWNQREVRQRIVDAVAGVFHLHLTREEQDNYIEVLDQDGWRAFHLEDARNQPQHVRELIRLMAMHEDVVCR